MATAEIQFDAPSLQGLETNAAPLLLVEGTNVKALARALDDTTEECANFKFQVPQNMDGAGTVTFRVACLPATAAASKNVAHTLGFAAVADGEDFDGSYTDEDSGDKAVEDTQDEMSIHSWTETVTNLGWVAGDLVFGRYSRPQAASDNLSGDLYLLYLAIEIPVT